MTTMLTTYAKPAQTAKSAGQRIQRYLMERYDIAPEEPVVNHPMLRDRATTREWGAGYCWSVALERDTAYEWAIDTDALYEACNIDRGRVFLEPQTSYMLCIYRQI